MPLIDVSFLREWATLRRIASIAACCAAAAFLYALVAPKWYRSVVTVLPARQQRVGISGMLGSELGGLAAGLDASGGLGADVPRIGAVLQSVTVTDACIEKYDLRKRYGVEYIESARVKLWSHCEVATLIKPGLVQLSCEDKDPRFVQELLGCFAEHGNQVFRRVGVASSSEEVRFLETRVKELRRQADETAADMREYQEKHHIVDLDTQAKAVVSSMSAIQSQRIAKQLELEYARTFSTGDEPALRQLQSQLAVLDAKLQGLAAPAEPDDASPSRTSRSRQGATSMFPAALSVPSLRSGYEKLFRDRKVAEATLVFALERLEGAKANEARNVSTFLVLDYPAMPTKPIRPKPLTFLVLGFAGGAISAIAYAWVISIGGFSVLASTRPSASPVTRAERQRSAASDI
jgi:tyrosine-protein kinase Etk/Wzc